MFLAHPWSTPCRSEAMMLVTVLLASTMMAAALLYNDEPSRFVEYVWISIVSTIMSSAPPQLFLQMMQLAIRFDVKQFKRAKSMQNSNRADIYNRRRIQVNKRTDGKSVLSNQLKEPDLVYREGESLEWRGKRVATMMFSVLCARKAARTIIVKLRGRSLSTRAGKTAAFVLFRAMGVKPDVERLTFVSGKASEREALMIPEKARVMVYLLMMGYAAL